jgi:hypothetical protein
MTAARAWLRVVFAADCSPCSACDEPVCPVCDEHYVDCECPGPTQDDLYEYEDDGKGGMRARALE